jgi:F-type H+-transporting ATPase subunit delta
VAEPDRLIRGYAEALLSIAEAEGSLEQVEDELYRFAQIVQQQPALREALTDPGLNAERKRQMLEELLGSRANPQTVGLLGFLVEQGHARDLSRIIAALAELAAERRRRALAEVRSAVPLDEDQRKRLASALSKATGRDVEVKVLVDPSVIGGVVARVGEQVFDGTIRHRLDVARQQLARAQ